MMRRYEGEGTAPPNNKAMIRVVSGRGAER